MKDLIRSEALKLKTTRGALWLLLGAVAINVFAVVAPGENAIRDFARPLAEQQSWFIVTTLMRILLLVLGIRAITEEFRHGTITPTLLATPDRTRVVSAKAVAVSAAGGIIAVVATLAWLGSMAMVAELNMVTIHPIAESWRSLAGMALAGTAWPVVGLGVGLLVRSQAGAIVGGIVWLMALEEMLAGRLGDLGGFLPGRAGLLAALAPTGRALWLGAVSLLAYAVLAMVAGWASLDRRDIA
jgi:ABC-type transport system involved in multi-copper enzyme maturation permease subunit